MLVNIILTLIVIVNGLFVYSFIKDLKLHWSELKDEPGNPITMFISQFIIYFLSTFGISDFAIGAALYPKMKWVNAKRLPGTLNTACVIPVATMALAYITSIEVALPTLIVAIVAQVIGAYISPKFVVKLPARTIKYLVSIGLFVAAAVILAGKFGWMPAGGTATGLTGWKLVVLGIGSFIFGAFNNMGIGSYALTMATVFALGLDPRIAFPIMMGACTFSVPVGSMQFIKLDAYSRKITLFSATAGVIGVLIAVFIVKSLDVSILQWVVVAVILYSALSLLSSLRQSEEE
ncbi:hypothetical protein ACWOA0_08845 [Ignavigranum ruoffiae]|uniref:Sulfite exporter TauE/SafE n=1 Tax=Ignavigranum ruoffiae TaxID=89093 RepID=A0A1H9GGV4_9LACT|nr:sulfite exporter TauE/SafE family protein [Ignavigranum ruoffiae]UPQ86594.1 sulfite exporter TauE/SafE family protein [Ignavigranum ruoffiae]SEQ49325.1 Sulfite exporter TauE/SafE [Ignavigranum ruoffiae]